MRPNHAGINPHVSPLQERFLAIVLAIYFISQEFGQRVDAESHEVVHRLFGVGYAALKQDWGYLKRYGHEIKNIINKAP